MATSIRQFSKNIKPATTIAFWICLCISAGMFIAGFVVPPVGVVDPSVFQGIGWLFAFATLATAREAIRQGMTTRITHNDTNIEIKHEEQK